MLKSVSVVVPVYNAEDTLDELVRQLMLVLGASVEIILVDDGSADRSWAVIERLSGNHDNVLGWRLMRNYGQHNATMCGLRQATGDIIVTLDDDLQNPPEEVPRLIEKLIDEDLDLVYGTPGHSKKHARWRNLGSQLVRYFYRRVFNASFNISSFRVMTRSVAETIFEYDLNYTYIDGLLGWSTRRIAEVPVEHRSRESGASGYTVGQLLSLALNLFTNFSLIPLQVVSAIGVMLSLVGFALGGYYVLDYFLDDVPVPGYASVIVAIFVLGGAQLLALGIFGEYLGRIHMNINRKPQYRVRTTSSDAAASRSAQPIVAVEPTDAGSVQNLASVTESSRS